MKPEMGPPELQTFSFPGEDTSWAAEFQAFQKELAGQKTDLGTLEDALQAMAIVSQTYDQSAATFQS
jgi:predicted dehydrogenase